MLLAAHTGPPVLRVLSIVKPHWQRGSKRFHPTVLRPNRIHRLTFRFALRFLTLTGATPSRFLASIPHRRRNITSPGLGGSAKGNSNTFPSSGKRRTNSSCLFHPLIHLLVVPNKTHPLASKFPAPAARGASCFCRRTPSSSAESFWKARS